MSDDCCRSRSRYGHSNSRAAQAARGFHRRVPVRFPRTKPVLPETVPKNELSRLLDAAKEPILVAVAQRDWESDSESSEVKLHAWILHY